MQAALAGCKYGFVKGVLCIFTTRWAAMARISHYGKGRAPQPAKVSTDRICRPGRAL